LKTPPGTKNDPTTDTKGTPASNPDSRTRHDPSRLIVVPILVSSITTSSEDIDRSATHKKGQWIGVARSKITRPPHPTPRSN